MSERTQTSQNKDNIITHCQFKIRQDFSSQDKDTFYRRIIDLGFKVTGFQPLSIEQENTPFESIIKLLLVLNKEQEPAENVDFNRHDAWQAVETDGSVEELFRLDAWQAIGPDGLVEELHSLRLDEHPESKDHTSHDSLESESVDELVADDRRSEPVVKHSLNASNMCKTKVQGGRSYSPMNQKTEGDDLKASGCKGGDIKEMNLACVNVSPFYHTEGDALDKSMLNLLERQTIHNTDVTVGEKFMSSSCTADLLNNAENQSGAPVLMRSRENQPGIASLLSWNSAENKLNSTTGTFDVESSKENEQISAAMKSNENSVPDSVEPKINAKKQLYTTITGNNERNQSDTAGTRGKVENRPDTIGNANSDRPTERNPGQLDSPTFEFKEEYGTTEKDENSSFQKHHPGEYKKVHSNEEFQDFSEISPGDDGKLQVRLLKEEHSKDDLKEGHSKDDLKDSIASASSLHRVTLPHQFIHSSAGARPRDGNRSSQMLHADRSQNAREKIYTFGTVDVKISITHALDMKTDLILTVGELFSNLSRLKDFRVTNYLVSQDLTRFKDGFQYCHVTESVTQRLVCKLGPDKIETPQDVERAFTYLEKAITSCSTQPLCSLVITASFLYSEERIDPRIVGKFLQMLFDHIINAQTIYLKRITIVTSGDAMPILIKLLDSKKDPVVPVNSKSDRQCHVCNEKPTTLNLECCGNRICNQCPKSKRRCPFCKQPCGILTGDQPEGSMAVEYNGYLHAAGYEGTGVYTITYYFPPGIQGENHPNPGRHYPPTTRTAYLPNVDWGFKVLQLLRIAFLRCLTFKIGTSLTSGMSDVITWSNILHKTFLHPDTFGYPDLDYPELVLSELRDSGVTFESMSSKEQVALQQMCKSLETRGRFYDTVIHSP